jgi:hypothetical protein
VADRFPSGASLQIRGGTALETDLTGAQSADLDLRGDTGRFSFVAKRALTTLGIHLSARTAP